MFPITMFPIIRHFNNNILQLCFQPLCSQLSALQQKYVASNHDVEFWLESICSNPYVPVTFFLRLRRCKEYFIVLNHYFPVVMFPITIYSIMYCSMNIVLLCSESLFYQLFVTSISYVPNSRRCNKNIVLLCSQSLCPQLFATPTRIFYSCVSNAYVPSFRRFNKNMFSHTFSCSGVNSVCSQFLCSLKS